MDNQKQTTHQLQIPCKMALSELNTWVCLFVCLFPCLLFASCGCFRLPLEPVGITLVLERQISSLLCTLLLVPAEHSSCCQKLVGLAESIVPYIVGIPRTSSTGTSWLVTLAKPKTYVGTTIANATSYPKTVVSAAMLV